MSQNAEKHNAGAGELKQRVSRIRSRDERKAEIKEQMKALQTKYKRLTAREVAVNRKQRTGHLIMLGTLFGMTWPRQTDKNWWKRLAETIKDPRSRERTIAALYWLEADCQARAQAQAESQKKTRPVAPAPAQPVISSEAASRFV